MRLIALCFIFCLNLATYGAPSSEMIRKRALTDLDCIQHMFEIKYAPREWKKEFANWDLESAIREAKNKIENLASPTAKECQIVIRDFFNSTQDYHVGVRFFSTESATLPFLIKGGGGRYFVCDVDEDQSFAFPFQVGDEILSFGGKPIHEAIVELREREFGHNTLETDHALAELALTQRKGAAGQLIPSGKIEIVALKKGETRPRAFTLTWQYCPEKIRDVSKLNFSTGFLHGIDLQEFSDTKPALKKHHPFFEKFMIYHMWDHSYVGSFNGMNRHELGARSSYIPSLGKKTWSSSSDCAFDAYIFETASGKQVGYIRIPHYLGDEEEVEAFGSIMNLFQKRTDALVIDQINNPGGSLFYLYGLASTLTDRPLQTPKQRIALTQEEVYLAHDMLPYLDQVTDDESACHILGDTVGGYPVDYQYVRLNKEFCYFLINQWNSGKLFSEPTFMFGVNAIKPHPRYRYSKPVLFLVNALDFSCGDYLPAILQDNQRAMIMGVRTAGAGGYVISTSYPNHLGIKHFMMTGSLGERKNRQPIENLGVVPNKRYELSICDLQENYREYAAAIVNQVESL